ncbi:hypothetical protein LKM13_24110 [Bacillus anthracis]|uniref:hypothetical protein n=1 Tax=Bacillus anthracis TaxID=1392 RepID=UPI001D0F06E1|nr:hypothetical protein [Bacillus anthracis]MCC2347128.1 hypothetical protein [Bacillus anthracis]
MKQYDVYKLIQILILILVVISCFFITFQDKPGFLPYINLISFLATISMLLIVMLNKIDGVNIIVDDKNKHKQHIYRLLSVLIIFSLILMFTLPSLNVTLNPKLNDILGVLALGIALSTDLIAIYLVKNKTKKDVMKFKQRYPLYDKTGS